MTSARYLGLRLFLEGIEVDVVQAAVSGAMSAQGGSATVVVPASDTAMKFLPRTLVHLFYLESSFHSIETAAGVVNADLRRNLDIKDPRHWRLLFCGEIRGYSVSKLGGQRTVVLSCSALSSYWSQAQVYWGTGNTAIHSVRQTIFSGAVQLSTSGNKVHSTDALLRLLRASPASNPTLPGVLGGVVSLLEAATGVFTSSASKRFKGVNDFMSQAELRLHLTRMIAASPDDTTSAEFIKTSEFSSYLSRVTRSVRSTSSLMDLVTLVLSKIYHNIAFVPAPPYVAPTGDKIATKVVRSAGVKFNTNTELGRLRAAVAAARALITSRDNDVFSRTARGKAHSDDIFNSGKPDADRMQNVVEKGEVVPDTARHKQFTDACHKLDLIRGYKNDGLNELSVRLRKEVRDKTSSPAPHAAMNKVLLGIEEAGKMRKALLEIMEPVGGKYPNHTNTKFSPARIAGQKAVGLLGGVPSPTKTVAATVEASSRLNSFLVVPDLFMAVPPKCNVLFPDHVQAIQFSQDFFSEITRLWLHGRTHTGVDRKDVYFSPNASIWGGTKAKDSTEAVKKGTSFTMHHELFSGIIPSIEGLGDTDIFKRIHTKAVAADKAKGSDGSNAAGQALYSPQEHLQRAANYIFFSKRYSGRTAVLTCRFSPQIVVGLPAVVLDPIISTTSAGADSREGTHFVGLVSSVSHTLHASGGGQTVVQLSSCRRYDEGVDLFGGENGQVVGETTVKKVKVAYKKARGKSTALNASVADDRSTVEGFTVAFNPTPAVLAGKVKPSVNPHDLSTLDGIVLDKDKKYEVVVREDFLHDVVNTDLSHGNQARTQLLRIPLAEFSTEPTAPTFPYTSGPDYDGTAAKATTGGVPAVEAARRAGAGQGTWRVMTAYDPRKAGPANPPNVSLYDPNAGADPNEKLRHRVYVDLYEVVQKKVSKGVAVSFAFEDTVSPPWHSPIYLPANIGDKFYTPMLGCTSMLDALDVKADEAPADTTTVSVDQGNGHTTRVQVPASLTAPHRTVAEACVQLADSWLKLMEMGADIDLFVDTYTNRSYASLYDMFGTQNPHLSMHLKYAGGPPLPDIEGFHGNAFGRYSNLESAQGGRLDYEPLAAALGTTDVGHVDGRVDPRLARYERVEQHKLETERRARRTNTPEPQQPAAATGSLEA